MRTKILRVIIIVLFIFIVIGLFYIQAIQGQYYYNLSTNNRIRVVPFEGGRGKIYDRNGKILADNRMSYSVTIVPQEIQDAESLFSFLSKILHVNAQVLRERYLIRKYTPFTPVVIAEDIGKEAAIVFEENKYRFPSIIIQDVYQRLYPQAGNSAHVLGYVGKINSSKLEKIREYGYSPQSIVGYSGVEEYYDNYLRGTIGGYQVEVNSRGKQVRLLGFKEPANGQDIVLTIDSDIQQMAQDTLGSKSGTIIAMDMDSGEILAMTSAPAYDPNIFNDPAKSRQISSLFSDSSSPLLNRAIRAVIPPGSVFKIPVAVCALDQKKISPSTVFDCQGFYELGQTRFGCTHVHNSQNLTEAIAHSCNVYFYHLGLLLGEEKISRYAEMFGLGKLTAIDLPHEKSGSVPNRIKRYALTRKKWYAGDTLNLAIGQGDVLVNPLQLVKMIATVANNGLEVQPHVISTIGGQPVTKYDFARKLDINPEVFDSVKKGLRATVTDYSGTAHSLYFDDLYVAGKTGTAQTVAGKEHHAWFVGYAEGENRRIAIGVLLEYGGSSQNACLVVRDFLTKMKDARLL